MRLVILITALFISLNVSATVIGNNGLNVQEYIWDVSKDGGTASTAVTLSAKDGYSPLPVGAIVTSVKAHVITAVDSATDDATLIYGNDDTDGYSGSAIAEASLTANAIVNGWDNGAALIWDDSNDHPIDYYVSSAAEGAFVVTPGATTITAGKIRFHVLYLLGGRD